MACVNNLINGAPLFLVRGVDDQSIEQISIDPLPRPQHLPVFIIQAERGKTTAQIVGGGLRNKMYGSKTFSETGPYTNHQTIASNICMSAANVHKIVRVSNATKANVRLSLEITPAVIPLYQRTTAGKYVYNNTTGALVPITPAATVNGYRLRWVVGGFTGDLGSGLISTYTQDGETNVTTVYPILDTIVDDPGEFGNNCGYRLYADTRSGVIDVAAMETNKAFPYQFSLMERTTSTSAPQFSPTKTGERVVTVTFNHTSAVKPPNIMTSTFIENVVKDQYQNTTDARYPLVYSSVGDNIHAYTDNVNDILASVGATELAYLTANPTAVTGLKTDLLGSTGGFGLMNLATAVDHKDIPYYTVVIDETDVPGSSVRLSQYTTIYNRGAVDNIMSVAEYEAAVVAEIAKYADCSNQVQDIARNPESIFYDTGFTLDTKLELGNFITLRPDLNLVLSTHEDSNEVSGYTTRGGSSLPLSMAEEISRSSILQTRIRVIPSSEFFGTPNYQAIIFNGSGILRNSQWTKRVPITMEMLYKASLYMGNSSGKWNKNYRFSRAPGSIFTLLKDITVNWVPDQTVVSNWDAGINMPMAYNEQFMAMPSLQTVYPEDTSILNDWLPTLAIGYLHKVAHAAWREYRGVDDMTNGQLVSTVNKYVSVHTENIWDDRYLVIPDAEVTTDDEARGTSWHINVKFGSNKSKTTEIVKITAYRRADLEALSAI